mmetsp:Transcript_17191/g.53175  ORF Transcript_17191/g.53175 Transcript_17191/m.53175 type:complete len:675 (-) Transcript_17191:781-2805(-)
MRRRRAVGVFHHGRAAVRCRVLNGAPGAGGDVVDDASPSRRHGRQAGRPTAWEEGALPEEQEKLLAENEPRELDTVLPLDGVGDGEAVQVGRLEEGDDLACRNNLGQAHHGRGGHVRRAQVLELLCQLVMEEGDALERDVRVIEASVEQVARVLGHQDGNGHWHGVGDIVGRLDDNDRGGNGHASHPCQASRRPDQRHAANVDARLVALTLPHARLSAHHHAHLPHKATQGCADDDAGHEHARGDADAVGEAGERGVHHRDLRQLRHGNHAGCVEEELDRLIQLLQAQRGQDMHLALGAREAHESLVGGRGVKGQGGPALAKEVRAPEEHHAREQAHRDCLQHLVARGLHVRHAPVRELHVEVDEERSPQPSHEAEDDVDGQLADGPGPLLGVEDGLGGALEGAKRDEGGLRHVAPVRSAHGRAQAHQDGRSRGAKECGGGERGVPVLHGGGLLEDEEHAADGRGKGASNAAGTANGHKVALVAGCAEGEEGPVGPQPPHGRGEHGADDGARVDHGAFLAHGEVGADAKDQASHLGHQGARVDDARDAPAVEVALHLGDARALGALFYQRHAHGREDDENRVEAREGEEGWPGRLVLRRELEHEVRLEGEDGRDGARGQNGHTRHAHGHTQRQGEEDARGSVRVAHARCATGIAPVLIDVALQDLVVHVVKVES